MSKKVYVGVGHGSKDPGAVALGFKESELALDVANALTEKLKENNVQVKQSRNSQDGGTIDINSKVKEANDWGADVYLDIHFNAGGGDGAEVFCSIKGGAGKTMAENICSEFVRLGQNSRGVKTKVNDQGVDYFGVIRQTKMPANIVECAFIDNATDMKLADTLSERKAMGIAIAIGVMKFLDVPEKGVQGPKGESGVITPTTPNKNTADDKRECLVKVTVANLNIRKGAGTNFAVVGSIKDRGTYTIVGELAGKGSDKGWGKLKSGAGWISLDHVTNV